MVTGEDLKKIVMLTYLTDSMLDNLAQIIDILNFDRDEILFRENEPAERFYMLKSGNVLLEQRISDEVTAVIASIEPGLSFGWAAMVAGSAYGSDAVCVEPSEIYSFKQYKAQELFAQNPEMGFRMYQRLLVIIKNRLDHRTEQFRQAIKNHPDMHNLFSS
jgi:CRP-like cAMP-binding protein